jgi:hypothetical protein
MSKQKATPAKPAGQPVGEHKGRKILFDFDSKNFRVEGLITGYPSYRDATSAIDRSESAKDRLRFSKLGITLLRRTGERLRITGIKEFGVLATKPPIDPYETDLYVDMPWILKALSRVKELEKEQQHIKRVLHPFQINVRNLREGVLERWHRDLVDRQQAASLTDFAKESASKTKGSDDDS